MRDVKNNEDFVPLPTVRLDARRIYVIWQNTQLVDAFSIRYDQTRSLYN